jgi:serine protease AprX
METAARPSVLPRCTYRRRTLTIGAAGFMLSLAIALLGAGTSWANGHSNGKGVSWDPVVTAKGVSWDPVATAKGVSWDPMTHGFVARGATAAHGLASYDPSTDVGSMQNTTLMTGAQAYWQAGYTGAGVDVALIDTGVSPVPGLEGKIINGPDISFDSQASNLLHLDGAGHGTFLAGIITGMAPGSRILSVKVGNYSGQVDVSQVIAAIGWVVQHRNDNGMNIRVLNLSYGTNGTQDYQVDPLTYAIEQAWKAGIAVVTSAGNAGFVHGGSLTDPSYDPFVITVGAADTQGTVSTGDDTVASFSSNSNIGPDKRTIDLLAPGVHIVSLRDPGSFIDQNYGSTGYVTDTLFRGSGTSQAAAFVSGALALLIQQHPDATNDQLKAMLSQGADHLKGVGKHEQGNGELDLSNNLTMRVPGGNPQSYPSAKGTGSLEGSRGGLRLVLDGVTLSGEQDIFGHPFNSTAIAALEAAGNSWSGGNWNGNSWSGNSWSGNSWSGNSWSGNSWSGNSWSGNSWSGNSWSGNSWSGNSWSGNSWSGNSWSGNSWSDGAWG